MRPEYKCRRVGNIKWIRNTEQEKSKMKILNSPPEVPRVSLIHLFTYVRGKRIPVDQWFTQDRIFQSLFLLITQIKWIDSFDKSNITFSEQRKRNDQKRIKTQRNFQIPRGRKKKLEVLKAEQRGCMSNRGSDVHKRKENKGRVNRKQGRYATKLKSHPLLYSLVQS